MFKGTFMALQPVAVGVNGEIGYVAVPQPTPDVGLIPGAEMGMDPPPNYINNMFVPSIQNSSHATSPMDPSSGGFNSSNQSDCTQSQEALRLESERMKHELEVLQKKISCLNTQRMNYSSSGGGNSSLTNGSGSTNIDMNVESHPSNGIIAQNETNQLTSELQLIENTIKDREREIIVNRSTDMTDNANGGAANLEYGSYLSQGMLDFIFLKYFCPLKLLHFIGLCADFYNFVLYVRRDK